MGRVLTGKAEDYDIVLSFVEIQSCLLDGLDVANLVESNGMGNPKRIMWESNKEVMYNMEDALISAESLAMLAGTETSVGVKQVHKKEVLTLGDGEWTTMTVELAETPTSEDGYAMFVFVTEHGFDIGEAVPVNATNGYQIAGDTITFAGTVEGHEYEDGDQVIVDYYYDSAATAKEIVIESSNFPGYYKIEADTVWTREHDGVILPAKFTMPRTKIASNFTISNAADGDPSVFTFAVECFPDSSDRMVVIDVIE